MPDEIRVSRPQQGPAMSQPATQPAGYPAVESPKKASKMPWIILAVVVVVLVVVGVLFRDKLFGAKKAEVKGTSTSQNAEYQAVFLTNGQVYFGKLSAAEATYVKMKDIYYLQVIQPPLQGSGQTAEAQAAAQTEPQISLVKLGNELHGPVDEMSINRDQILFFEDLKEDGMVVKAIRQYTANPPK